MALIKIGNVKGPKGDKGDKGYPELVVRSVQSSPQTNVNIEQDTEVEGKYYLDFEFPKGDTGNGIANVTGQKVDGGTDVTFNYTDGNSDTFKLLDGLNGDGVLNLEATTPYTGNSVADAFLYIYNNVSEYNKFFSFNQYNSIGSYFNYLGYVAKKAADGTKKISIVLFELHSSNNMMVKYTLDWDNLTSIGTTEDIKGQYKTETIGTGIVDLGTLYGTGPGSSDFSELNRTDLDTSVLYIFMHYGIKYIMQIYRPISTTYIQTVHSLSQNGVVYTRRTEDSGATWQITTKTFATTESVETAKAEVQNKIGVIELGTVLDLFVETNELNEIKTTGIYSFKYNGIKPYLMFVYQYLNKIHQFIYGSDVTEDSSNWHRWYDLDTEEWNSETGYSLVTKTFVENQVGSLNVINLGTLEYGPQDDNYIADTEYNLNNSTSNEKLYIFNYANNFYIMTVENDGTNITQNIIKNNSSIFKRYVKSYNHSPYIGSETVIGSSSSGSTTKQTLYEHNIDLTLVTGEGVNMLGSTALLTIVSSEEAKYTTSTLYNLLKQYGLRSATGMYASNQTTGYHIYGIKANNDGFRISYDAGGIGEAYVTFPTDKVTVVDSVRTI